MKKNFTPLFSLPIFLLSITCVNAQESQVFPSVENICGAEKAMEELFHSNPQAKEEQEAREAFTQQYIQDHPEAGHTEKISSVAKYRIPVVFHVYGGATHTFWGKTVTKAIIDGAIAELNLDFQGLCADYNNENQAFTSVKSKLDISFELAKKKADGSVTDGIDWKTTTGAGYGGTGVNAQVAADAWNNKMYMNIYIVADLYNDGVNNNSGVCWYPNVSMTNANTARLVYNGQYLGTNSTNAEFRGVLTHEAGHFLNLAHTFDGNSCTGAGDNVSDTPSHTSTSLSCHPAPAKTSNLPQECGHLVMTENFMDYNGAFCGQSMFSTGQVARMTAALNLNDVTRFPLWQTSNLIATGLLPATGMESNDSKINVSNVFPNPANGKFQIELNVSRSDAYTLEVTNLVGQLVHKESLGNLATGYYQTHLDITEEPAGIYFLSVTGSDEVKRVVKMIKQ